MARRRKIYDGPKLAFEVSETGAIESSIQRLYRRSLFHLVASKYTLPNLVDVYRSLIPADVQQQFDFVRDNMVASTGFSHWQPSYEVMFGFSTMGTLQVKSRIAIPDPNKVPLVNTDPHGWLQTLS